MAFLIAATVLVGLLCCLNLILLYGVIRRLRVHAEMLAGNPLPGAPAMIAAGDAVGDFNARTVDGEELSRAEISDKTMVGFFSPSCESCKEKIPRFLELSRMRPGGRGQVLAVIVDDHDEAGEFVDELNPAARVIVERYDGPVSKAFGTSAFPAMLTVTRDHHDRLVVETAQVGIS
ncbi:TlpA family protein disulfide reductase [Actinomadura formosensis]|uniref:TlpA family protein disulfide reductase n=1 Tax=Actinomadura formosensis TaxID=60706 RepID=UPI00082ED2CA|nr:TlpA disulfide reductase family protein [Actinomadura formosensis]